MKVLALFFAGILISFYSFGQNASDKLIGTYLTGDGSSKVEFYKNGNKYYGKIVWLKDPINAKTHKPETDTENPNPAKKNDPVMGMVIVQGISFNSKGNWDGGTIYDPNTGKSWDCTVSFDGNKLKVKGYWKFSWIGKTEIWIKA